MGESRLSERMRDRLEQLVLLRAIEGMMIAQCADSIGASVRTV